MSAESRAEEPHFESMHDTTAETFETPHIPAAHDLAGGTIAANEAHSVARVALLNLLHEDEELSKRFQAWAEEVGLEPIATRAAELLEATATSIYGFESRGWLFVEDESDIEGTSDSITIEVESVEEGERLRELPGQAREAYEDFHERCFGSDDRLLRVAERISDMVRYEWGLPWPWLAIELIQMFNYGLIGYVLGRSYRFNIWYVPPLGPLDQPASDDLVDFRISLTSADGTTNRDLLSKAVDQINNEIRAILDKIEAEYERPELPIGRRTAPEQIERDVDWLYRRLIQGETVSAIERDYKVDPDSDARKTVRDGIARAYEMLSTTAWTFDLDET